MQLIQREMGVGSVRSFSRDEMEGRIFLKDERTLIPAGASKIEGPTSQCTMLLRS